MSDAELLEFLKRLRGEARWGLDRSHGGPQHKGKCNAQDALRIVIGLIDEQAIAYANRVIADTLKRAKRVRQRNHD